MGHVGFERSDGPRLLHAVGQPGGPFPATKSSVAFLFRSALSSALPVLLLSASLLLSCESDSATGFTGAGAGSNTGGSGGKDSGPDPKELFDALETELVAACESCHRSGGIADTPFLALPERYDSAVSWPGIVRKEPAESILLTYAKSGSGHTGTNLDAETLKTSLLPKVEAWLAAEAAAIQGEEETKPHVEPIVPILGFNAIYLDALDAKLKGMALTFTAAEPTPNLLELTDIEVHTTASTGLHIVHPLFVVYPKGLDPDPDPVDNFAGLDVKFEEGTTGTLSTGTMVLTNWKSGSKVSIVFEVAEAYVAMSGEGGGGGGGPGSACGAVQEFTDNARAPLTASCVNCHGGNNTQATNALDMSDLAGNPGETCGQVKNRVNLANPNASQLFVTTDPNGNAAHPFKFQGNQQNFQNFRAALTAWIQIEAQ